MAEANMDIAYGTGLSTRKKRELLKEAYGTFALVMLDVFWFSRDTTNRARHHTTFDPVLASHLFKKQAHLCVTAHLGNWELLGHAVSARGFPLSSVAAPLVNPEVDRQLSAVRKQSGQLLIPREGALRGMLRTLKHDGKVGLLLDQNTPPADGGVFVDFFGLPVPVSDAAAALALKTGTPILFGFCIPGKDGTYHVHSAPVILPTDALGEDAHERAVWITRRIADTIEKAIRQHPGAWLWMYRRWRYIPDGVDPARYPFYAKR